MWFTNLFNRRAPLRSAKQIDSEWERDLAIIDELKADPTLSSTERLERIEDVLLAPVYGGEMFGHLPYDPFTLKSRVIGPGASQGSFVRGRWTGGAVK